MIRLKWLTLSIAAVKSNLIRMTSSAQQPAAIRHSSAADRNKQPLLEALQTILPSHDSTGVVNVLEIASGSGQHASHCAGNLSNLLWQPSECDPACMQSIEAHVQMLNKSNLLRPVHLDVSEPHERWGDGKLTIGSYDIVLCVNLIHITPWSYTEGLFKGSSYYLKDGGHLMTYGPYRVNGKLTPESNVMFDQSLRLQNKKWGVRDIDDLKTLAQRNGLKLENIIEMPANNKVLMFRKMSEVA